MATATAPAPSVLHPRAAGSRLPRGRSSGGSACSSPGRASARPLMGILGLVMRLTQATLIGISPAWFYRLMTLHGWG